MLRKTIFREIIKSFGRYIAILMIVALGVGFFSGLRVSRDAMLATGNRYLTEINYFDFQGLSTLGFDEGSLKTIKEKDFVREAEGSIEADILFNLDGNDQLVFKTLSIPKSINLPTLTEGRMPTASDECLIDNTRNDAENLIGKTIVLSNDNSEDAKDMMKHSSYKIVGAASSPLYMNYERGTTSVGSGTVTGFLYVNEDSFDIDYFTSIYVTVGEVEEIYSEAYTNKIEATEEKMKDAFTEAAEAKYDSLYKEYEEEYEKEIADKREEVIAEALEEAGDLSAYGPMASTIEENIIKEAGEAFDEEVGEMPEPPFDPPKVYSLDRETNVGYVCFDSDTSIISSIARIFPIFFFMVAALVCMTSMARMIDEQRTQIGVLKAMGYSNGSILWNYLLYSGSASIIGGIIGFVISSYLFPYVVWRAYSMMYDFSDSVDYVFDWKLGGITILVALLCTNLATLSSCLSDTKEVPAELIRPKAPNPGKRILLEKIPFIWNKVSFLYKVSLRNIFRYKKRFLMMIAGVSGCTALLVAGFGINDSIKNVADYQYSEICKYDYTVVFDDETTEAQRNQFIKDAEADGHAKEILFCEQLSLTMTESTGNPLRLIATDLNKLEDFIDLHYRGESIDLPKTGEIIICESYAEMHGISAGDKIRLQDDNLNDATFTVSGICENYIYNYGYVSSETFEKEFGRSSKNNTAFVITDISKEASDRDDILNQAAAKIRDDDNVASVALADEFRHRIDNMMKSLNAIVFLVVASAGVLAFIVIYNLTNINITERIREIATIKVLGFYGQETSAYVFRENVFLTGISAVVGLDLGKYLHAFIIGEIKVDMIFFPTRIMPISYVYAVILTFVFAILVMIALVFKLRRISMTESLKTVE